MEQTIENKKTTGEKDSFTWQERISPYRRWLEIGGLLLIMALGLFVRLEDIQDWKKDPARAFFQGEPLLTTYDGYFYLTLARDLAEGGYHTVDEKRAIPDGVNRPSRPPLMSVIAAGISKITPYSLNWIGAVLPAVLGVLLALPLYGIGRYYGGIPMGYTSALMGVLAHYYVYRSNLGWFDTDCMNTTWAMALVWAFLHFGINQTRKRYFYLLAGGIIYVLFLWWWDQTPQVVTVTALLPFLVALIFFYRPSKKEGQIFLGTLGALLVCLLIWKGFDLPAEIFKKIMGSYKYISKETSGVFPNMGVTISEQGIPSFDEIVRRTTANSYTLILSGLGICLLFWKKKKESLFLAAPLALGCLSFLFAKRFAIFLSPITALGLGYLVIQVWLWRKKWYPLTFISPVLVLIMAYPALSLDLKKTFWPKEKPPVVAGMNIALKSTPEDAVIWAWWDHGYPMVFFSRRGTINDGSVHNSERSVYNGFPMATHHYRQSANFMQFYVHQGVRGLNKFYKAAGHDKAQGMMLAKTILAQGPVNGRKLIQQANLKPVGEWKTVDDWLRFFFPPDPRPVYLFLDWRLIDTSYWWFWLGSWDIAQQDGYHPSLQKHLNMRDDQTGLHGKDVFVNPIDGVLILQQKKRLALQEIQVNNGGKITWKNNYNNQKGTYFDFFAQYGIGIHQDAIIANSVFSKLFIRHDKPKKYFKPVALNSPFFQIWKVEADSLDNIQ
jgi:hypothetical protein